MLRYRKSKGEGNFESESAWITVLPGGIASGLHEDTDYQLAIDQLDCARLFVDDVEIRPDAAGVFAWRPSFYAGRVAVHIESAFGPDAQYHLDVSPSTLKSGQVQFDDMVAAIREFDPLFLGGTSAASIEFGHAGQIGRYSADILLTRLRAHGPAFLDAVESIVRSPHRALEVERQRLPLSRIRRLHASAMRDRRLAAFATGQTADDAIEALLVSSRTPSPTFDTPANRALLALLRRFGAALNTTQEKVRGGQLGTPPDEQILRRPRRLEQLASLEGRVRDLLRSTLFKEASRSETSAAGLTQIAAQPSYSRAYRLGNRSLAIRVEGKSSNDNLHVPPSWGIYETWCFVEVLKIIDRITGMRGREVEPDATFAERAMRYWLPGGSTLEVLFQAKFPALDVESRRKGRSLSRERRPDLVLVHTSSVQTRMMILDAKWRSGRDYTLDAMQSAHIYHDALRLDDVIAEPCLLLLPCKLAVAQLEDNYFIKTCGVGAIGRFSFGDVGRMRFFEIVTQWLSLPASSRKV